MENAAIAENGETSFLGKLRGDQPCYPAMCPDLTSGIAGAQLTGEARAQLTGEGFAGQGDEGSAFPNPD